MKRISLAFLLVLISFSSFYISGWSIIWGDKLSQLNNVSYGDLLLSKQWLFGGPYIAFLFNSKYYGLAIVNRFFDSQLLSYCGFGVGIVSDYYAIKMLLTGSVE